MWAKMIHFLRNLTFIALLLLSACGGKSKSSAMRIGIDPSWTSLELPEKQTNVTAFSNELLLEISRLKKIQLATVVRSWDNLLSGLQEKHYEGVLSSLVPYNFNQKQYDFSDIYLRTGPVLVLPYNSSIDSLDELDGKEIAVQRGSPDAAILEKHPKILIRIYDSIPQAFNDILTGTVDGAIAPILLAESYSQDLYSGQLKVATPPLNDDGLRLITLHNQSPSLMKAFNKGLKELKENGTYAALARKWGLSE
jgi:polar amino acid transport system substrate-binding protein